MKPRNLILHILFLISIGFFFFYPLYHKAKHTPANSFYPFTHRIEQDYFYDLMVVRQGRTQNEEIDQYTHEVTVSAKVHLFYLLLGRFAQLIGINDITAYWGAMAVSLMLFYIFSYLLISIVIDKLYRWVAMALTFFASPFPHLTINLSGLQLSVGAGWWTGMDIYSRLTLLPHHFISVSLMIGACYFGLRFLQTEKWIYSLTASIFILISIIFFAVPGLIFIAAFSLTVLARLGLILNRRLADRYPVSRLFKFLLGYSFLIEATIIAILFVKNQLSSYGFPWVNFLDHEYWTYKPNKYPYQLSVLLISYGILPMFILPVISMLKKRLRLEYIFLLLMLIIPIGGYLLSENGFIDIPKTRFVYNAPYLFAGILATVGIQQIVNWVKSKQMKKFIFSVIMTVILLNVFLGLRSYWLPQLVVNSQDEYISGEYMDIAGYLNENTKAYSTILSRYAVGIFLPAYIHNKVYVGHEINTDNFYDKYEISKQFFNGDMNEGNASRFLKKEKIEYVMWDRGELSSAYVSLLTQLFQSGGTRVYKVK